MTSDLVSGSIAEIKQLRGFVPQDDIVHEHLTVRPLKRRRLMTGFVHAKYVGQIGPGKGKVCVHELLITVN